MPFLCCALRLGRHAFLAYARPARAHATPHALVAARRTTRAQGEKSARALELTRHLISFNGADYTAWQWRWQCVQALGGDVDEEMALTE